MKKLYLPIFIFPFLQKSLAQNPPAIAESMALLSATPYHPDAPVGRGETNERVMAINFLTAGKDNPFKISEFSFVLDSATRPVDLGVCRLYYSPSPRLEEKAAQLLGTTVAASRQLVFRVSRTLVEGDNHFWLTADIAQNAPEGAKIGAQLAGFNQNDQPVEIQPKPNLPTRTVLLEHKLLFSGGDFGAAAYRIPALASKGKRVVAVADARIHNNADLPNNIDLVARVSDDYGDTWSAPVTIANFGSFGASDPALVYDKSSGDLLCLFASHHGLFQSAPPNHIRFQVSRSPDFGITWSTPQDFSAQIYLPGWYAAWVASGSAQQLASGRIVAVVGARQNAGKLLSNFMIYSDDGGLSWHTSPGIASATGDEAKIASLDNGNLMMAIRAPRQRKVTFSSDGGSTWSAPVPEPELAGSAVNGDLIRYTSVKDGFDTSRLLYALAVHPTQRRNLSVLVSYDEGLGWATQKVICPGPSAYAALTAFDDGSIGLFYENGEYEQYQLYFARFSLEWLSGGVDRWTPAKR